ncbi:MAG TPA: hypothetical protein VK737_08960 [Opitutales bacterium]|jgi:hypothetical protein|nr:hypothetical protein [Opitutales bacterium]
MGGNTNFDPTGEKKARKKATMFGAVFCGLFNAALGALLGFCVLVATSPIEYNPKPDAKTGKTPDPPAGLFYWAGQPGGDYRAKASEMLGVPSAGVTITDSELNGWAAENFKAAPAPAKPAPKPAAPQGTNTNDIAKVKEEAKVAEAEISNFGMTPGTPNFHIFHDPSAPADIPFSLQVALPLKIDILGMEVNTIYQARGVFVTSANGPQFKPYSSYIGSARVPVAPGFAQSLFNDIASKFAASDAAKDYAAAWTKYPGAKVQDGALVLGGK